MRKFHQFECAVCFVVFALTVSAYADLRLPNVFSDHMVLQRDIAFSVWGWADPDEIIKVTMAGQILSTQADQNGQWKVRFTPLSANCKPLELMVTGKSTNAVIRDILVGDVWLCSGQSNMEWGMGGTDNAKEVFPSITNTMIRLLNIKSPRSPQPVDDILARWTMCDAQTVNFFSAVGYFFGRKIQAETAIPIGLINNAWGGSAIEAWISFDALAANPEWAALSREYTKKLLDYNALLAKSVEPVSQWVVLARQAQSKGETLPIPPFIPEHPAMKGFSGIYNGRVTPLLPYGIKGVIWYQGEANGGEGNSYADKMRALIGSWRKAWKQGDFPFYYVQLANFEVAETNPSGGTGWANTRMAQLKCLQIPHTGMASAIDLGVANNIHPRNKEDVGNRLALWALKNDYGFKDLICSGPLYQGMTIEGSKIRVRFDSVGQGLMVGQKTGHGPAHEIKNGSLKQFAISGASNAWFWADAVIDGATVLVSSTNVPLPVAVRYAFSMNPEGCNLYNKEGLPASPFRTDSW